MLSAEALSYKYERSSTLIDDVNFTLSPGEIVGLPGRSGIGKSTLALLLAGFLQPIMGQITCDGSPLPRSGYSAVQLIFQHPEFAINPRWKIEKVLQEGNPDYMVYVEKFGLHKDWLERYPHELSGGELQRIALIRIMNKNTRYILADEITASLDAGTQALIWNNVIDWAETRNVGILAISHDDKLLNRISSRIDNVFS